MVWPHEAQVLALFAVVLAVGTAGLVTLIAVLPRPRPVVSGPVLAWRDFMDGPTTKPLAAVPVYVSAAALPGSGTLTGVVVTRPRFRVRVSGFRRLYRGEVGWAWRFEVLDMGYPEGPRVAAYGVHWDWVEALRLGQAAALRKERRHLR